MKRRGMKVQSTFETAVLLSYAIFGLWAGALSARTRPSWRAARCGPARSRWVGSSAGWSTVCLCDIIVTVRACSEWYCVRHGVYSQTKSCLMSGIQTILDRWTYHHVRQCTIQTSLLWVRHSFCVRQRGNRWCPRRWRAHMTRWWRPSPCPGSCPQCWPEESSGSGRHLRWRFDGRRIRQVQAQVEVQEMEVRRVGE